MFGVHKKSCIDEVLQIALYSAWSYVVLFRQFFYAHSITIHLQISQDPQLSLNLPPRLLHRVNSPIPPLASLSAQRASPKSS